METNDIIPSVNETEAAREKFEQERMSRRAALRKLGLTTGFALFGMFAVDDLARVAIRKLAEHKETKAIADSIANDFKDMGVAFADDYDGNADYYDGASCTPNPGNADWCQAGGQRKQNQCSPSKGCKGCKTLNDAEVCCSNYDTADTCQTCCGHYFQGEGLTHCYRGCNG